ncbi:hypothetical protein [Undibacterium sp.]|uniref:hypothetical protein n=1 Tax=Undibacterium sp. TaxID=1914977 RepID=UPI00374D0CFD
MNNGIYGLTGQDFVKNPVPIGGMIAMSTNFVGNLAYGTDGSAYLRSGVVTDAKNFPMAPTESVFKYSQTFSKPPIVGGVGRGTALAFGNGVFMRISDSSECYTSVDGQAWNVATAVPLTFTNFVQFINGLFWTGGWWDGTFVWFCTSVDGVVWKKFSVTYSAYVVDIAVSNGTMVAMGLNTTSNTYSIDGGTTWVTGAFSIGVPPTAISGGSGGFVLMGNASQAYSTSTDGVNWTSRVLPVVTTSSPKIWFVNGLFLWPPSFRSTVIYSSPDGVSWTPRVVTAGNSTYGCIGYANGLYFMMSEGYYYTSPDLAIWTSRTPPFSFYQGSVLAQSWAYGNGIIVVFDTGGAANGAPAVCIDGVNFVLYGSDSIQNNGVLKSWAYGNGVYLAVWGNGGNCAIMRSTDGAQWKNVTSSNLGAWAAVSFANDRFFLNTSNTGTSGMFSSTDGLSWLPITVPNPPASTAWSKVAFNGSRYVCFANQAGQTSAAAISSPTGLSGSWTSRVLPSSHLWAGIATLNGTFTIAAADNATIAISADGDSWAGLSIGMTCDGLLAGNGLYVGYRLGTSTLKASTGYTTAYTSFTTPAPVLDMAFNSGLFFINTVNGIYQSTDLVGWSFFSTDTSASTFNMIPANGQMTLIKNPQVILLTAAYANIKRVANATAQFASSSATAFAKGVQLFMRVQ